MFFLEDVHLYFTLKKTIISINKAISLNKITVLVLDFVKKIQNENKAIHISKDNLYDFFFALMKEYHNHGIA